jgi:fluoroquinolone resistance protein
MANRQTFFIFNFKNWLIDGAIIMLRKELKHGHQVKLHKNSQMENERFEGRNFVERPLEKGDYEQCVFQNCAFADTNLAGLIFSECEFINCDFSNANLAQSCFRDVVFKQCKLFGLRFDLCNTLLLSFRFENSLLNYATFTRLKIKKTVFMKCQLHEVDFTGTDLSGALFAECDLHRATFSATNLEAADLSTSVQFELDPEANKIRKAKFSAQNALTLLSKYQIVIKD